MARKTFTPTVGAVIEFADPQWEAIAPEVSARVTASEISMNVSFASAGTKYVLTRVSAEEFSTQFETLTARLRVDYVLGHISMLSFEENIENHIPEWYIGADVPCLLITWQDENGKWYEPLIYDVATGEILNN